MRLIDADALAKHLTDELCFPISCEECTFFQPYDEKCLVEIWVDDAPTIDAVEVVRCKDCKHAYKRKPINKTAVLCELFGAGMKDNDFCSYGERREE